MGLAIRNTWLRAIPNSFLHRTANTRHLDSTFPISRKDVVEHMVGSLHYLSSHPEYANTSFLFNPTPVYRFVHVCMASTHYVALPLTEDRLRVCSFDEKKLEQYLAKKVFLLEHSWGVPVFSLHPDLVPRLYDANLRASLEK